jgi:hypothetical protein
MVSSILKTTIVILLFLTIVPQSVDALCKWHGVAPFCFIGNSCPDGCLKTAQSKKGDGLSCWISQKSYCCCVPDIG